MLVLKRLAPLAVTSGAISPARGRVRGTRAAIAVADGFPAVSDSGDGKHRSFHDFVLCVIIAITLFVLVLLVR